MRRCLPFSFVFIVCFNVNLYAAPNWGTGADVWWTDYQSGLPYLPEYDYENVWGHQSSTSLELDSPPGFSESFAQLQGHGMFPVLKVISLTDPDSARQFGTVANARAVEEFQYTGINPTTLTYNVTMSGLVNAIDGGAVLFSSTTFFEAVDFQINNISPSGTIKGSSYLDMSTITNPGYSTIVDSVSIDVVPGEIFYLYQSFGTETSGIGATADGFGTLLGEFTDSTHIIALSVPEPSALYLWCWQMLSSLAFVRHRAC